MEATARKSGSPKNKMKTLEGNGGEITMGDKSSQGRGHRRQRPEKTNRKQKARRRSLRNRRTGIKDKTEEPTGRDSWASSSKHQKKGKKEAGKRGEQERKTRQGPKNKDGRDAKTAERTRTASRETTRKDRHPGDTKPKEKLKTNPPHNAEEQKETSAKETTYGSENNEQAEKTHRRNTRHLN